VVLDAKRGPHVRGHLTLRSICVLGLTEGKSIALADTYRGPAGGYMHMMEMRWWLRNWQRVVKKVAAD